MRSGPAWWIAAFLLALYLVTAGGHGYSVDGAFGYEMAKTALLDPQHAYFHRFKTAFARWGALLPLLGQPFVLAGDAVSRAAPERDALTVDGHTFRVEEWPALGAGGQAAVTAPLPPGPLPPVAAVGLISFLANGTQVAQGAEVGQVRLWEGGRAVTLPVRAGIETAEWAHDRPDVAGQMQHRRASLAGHWIGQPRGNLYYARLALPAPMRVERWELLPGAAAGPAAWNVRAAAFQTPDGTWLDTFTGERYWSERQTRDFFTRLVYATLNAFTTAGAAILVYLLARQLGFSTTGAALGALGFGAGTMAWPYAKLDFSEPAATLFTLLAIWAFYRVFPLRCARPAEPGSRSAWRWGLVASAALLLAVVGKYTAALAGAALLGQWAVWSGWQRPGQRRRALLFLAALVLPAAAAGLAAGAVAYRLTGEVPIVLTSGTSRLREDWLALPLWTGLRGLLISPGKSLFLYSPWLLLALPGAWLLLRLKGRAAGVLFVLFPAVTVLLYGMKLVWHGGSWGPRYLLPIVPLLCVAAVPAVEWFLARGRAARLSLAGLAAVAVLVQLVATGKDPEQYPSMVREFVVPALPDQGSRLGGRDYWLARGGPGLQRALEDPQPDSTQRGLGYLWGYPTADLTVEVRERRTLTLSLYAVDWDAQGRRQTVQIDDAAGTRRYELDRDFSAGLWLSWQVTAAPGQPLRVGLVQRAADTAVISAVAFDPPRGERREAPDVDQRTTGSWRGVYGAEGYVLLAWRSFNVDVAQLPPYLLRYDLAHVGDKPDPRIHVEVAQQDVLDTPLLYAAPFSPLLGNLWLLAADAAHLLFPARPDLAQGVLLRPPWRWLGVGAPLPPHPEYGLGLDYWPTLLYTAYASHPGVLAVMWLVLLGWEVVLLRAAQALLVQLGGLSSRGLWPALGALALALAIYDVLQVRA